MTAPTPEQFQDLLRRSRAMVVNGHELFSPGDDAGCDWECRHCGVQLGDQQVDRDLFKCGTRARPDLNDPKRTSEFEWRY